jgi:hypothetical protein
MHNYLKNTVKLTLLILSFINLSLIAVDNDTKNVFMDVLLQEMHLRSKDYLGKESGEIENGVLNVNTVELRTITPLNDLFYQGEVLKPELHTVLSTKAGKIVYVLGENNYIFGTLYNDNDDPVIQGTMLAALDKKDINVRINAAKRRKKIAKMSHEFLTKMTKAHENLSKYKMITSFELDQKRIELLAGLLEYETSTRGLDETLITYKDPYIYTEKSGIIEKTYVEPGEEISEGQPILDILTMSSVNIKFKFPHSLVDLDIDKIVAYIYPQGASVPISATIIVKPDDEDHIYLHMPNKLYSTAPFTSTQKKLKKVFSIYNVENMLGNDVEYYFVEEYLNRGNEILCIPVESIRTDKNGTYVYKAKSINTKAHSKIPKILTAEKVYIELGDILENITYEMDIIRLSRSIKKNSNIKLGDILLGNSDPTIKDGEKVLRVPPSWLFYPGQSIKIKVPAFLKKGIYVPSSAIIHSGHKGNYVYIVQNGSLKLIKVFVDGAYNDYCLIISEELHDGQKIVLIDDDNLFEYLYEGRQVNVIKTEEPPIFLSKKHATSITNPSDSYMQYMNNNNNNLPMLNGPQENKMFNQYFGSKYSKRSKRSKRLNLR